LSAGLFALMFLSQAALSLWGSIVTYPNPPLPASTAFTVSANGTNLYVYNAAGFQAASFAFSGTLTIQVTYNGAITNYQINPLSAGITATRNGSTLTFTLSQPEKLEVQINGATSQVANGNQLLYLFADAPEVNPPLPSDPSVIYFAAGSNNLVGANSANVLALDFFGGTNLSINGKTDTRSRTLYLAPGAMLNATVTLNVNNFTVCGRGFICYPYPKATGNPTMFYIGSCTNLLVKDILLFNSQTHVLSFSGGQANDTSCCYNTISNVKSLHSIVNSDGISLFGRANHITIDNCLIIGNDNLIVLGGANSSEPLGLHDNLIQNSTFIKSSYAGNWAFPQGNSPPVTGGNIGPNNVVSNCDVVRLNGEVALVTGWWGNPSDFNNLLFENLRVQSFAGYLADLSKTNYNSFIRCYFANAAGDSTNFCRSMTLKNFYLPSAQTSFISNGNWSFTFDHVYVNGRAAASDTDLNLTKRAGVCTLYLYDLSAGKSAVADSEASGSPAANGNDGDPTSCWYANDTIPNHWWKVDLGATRQVTGANVMWPQAGNYRYKVEVSADNANWCLAVDNTASPATNQIQGVSFIATARYVRLTVTGLPPEARAGLCEFTVLGYDNISLNYLATANSQQSGHPAANGNDGNVATYWSANDPQPNHWWTADLGYATAQVTGCEVVWQYAANYKYKVEVSCDNTNWVLAVDNTAATNANQVQLSYFNAVGRYVRITVTSPPAGLPAAFYEFRVFGYENLSEGQIATSDSQQAGCPAANGNDWDPATLWLANDGKPNHWWSVDLGSPRRITGSEVTWPGSSNYQYKIEVSNDNASWLLALDNTGTSGTKQVQDDVFSAVARYVRITVTGFPAGCRAGFAEFKVYGVPSPIQPFAPVVGTGSGQFSPSVVFTQGGLAPALYGHPSAGNGVFCANFVGSPGTLYLVDCTTNLVAPWQLACMKLTSNAGGFLQLIDSNYTPLPARFYRVRLP
jgi:hypothetical protein